MGRSVGFVGTGLMGSRMVTRLLGAGVRVEAWNRTRDKLAPLVALGALEVATPAVLGAANEAILVSVSDTAALEAVVFGPDGIAAGLRRGALLIDLSTVRPDATRRMVARLREEVGAGWVDAPVTGGPIGAEQGKLIVMAGGEEADIELARTILAPLAQRVTHMGPVGAGQTTKLCSQVLGGCTVAALAEMTRLARDAGIDPARLPECLAGGIADSRLMQIFVPRMATRGFSPALAQARTIVKDLDMVGELARSTGTPLPMTVAATELFRALARRAPDCDQSELVTLFD